MQERRNSIANALELRLSYTNPSIYEKTVYTKTGLQIPSLSVSDTLPESCRRLRASSWDHPLAAECSCPHCAFPPMALLLQYKMKQQKQRWYQILQCPCNVKQMLLKRSFWSLLWRNDVLVYYYTTVYHIDGLTQNFGNFNALEMKLPQSYDKPLICVWSFPLGVLVC